MDSHMSPARAKEKGVHDRGPNEDNSSPNKAAKKKQRQAEEPMEVDDQVPSIMKTPKYTASAKLGFATALTEYRYNVLSGRRNIPHPGNMWEWKDLTQAMLHKDQLK